MTGGSSLVTRIFSLFIRRPVLLSASSSRSWLARVARGLPFALAALVLARTTIARVYAKLGHPGAALDDSFIHFQYARAFAEGHPFRFEAGEPTTSGATSLVWPALLAPFWLAGFRGEAILWPAWAMSFVALGALAYEARAIVRRLAGETAAIGAAAMVPRVPRRSPGSPPRAGWRCCRSLGSSRAACGGRASGRRRAATASARRSARSSSPRSRGARR